MSTQDHTLPPFVVVEGVINFRTIDGYSTSIPGTTVKSMHVFRSGDLSHISDAGKEKLRALGIKKVFDMRSDPEIVIFKTPSPVIDGIEFVRAPAYMGSTGFEPEDIATLLQGFDKNELQAFMEEYANTLRTAGPSFKIIFTHLRDKPEEPCIIHCTAGKDRTGLFAAILLLILGVSDQDIVKDYALTTRGIEPFAAVFAARFQKQPTFRDNWEGFLKMGSSREETMVATLKMIQKQFGGAKAYLKEYVGLDDDDLTKIRQNLTVQK